MNVSRTTRERNLPARQPRRDDAEGVGDDDRPAGIMLIAAMVMICLVGPTRSVSSKGGERSKRLKRFALVFRRGDATTGVPVSPHLLQMLSSPGPDLDSYICVRERYLPADAVFQSELRQTGKRRTSVEPPGSYSVCRFMEAKDHSRF